jgi:hypothetical protein
MKLRFKTMHEYALLLVAAGGKKTTFLVIKP